MSIDDIDHLTQVCSECKIQSDEVEVVPGPIRLKPEPLCTACRMKVYNRRASGRLGKDWLSDYESKLGSKGYDVSATKNYRDIKNGEFRPVLPDIDDWRREEAELAYTLSSVAFEVPSFNPADLHNVVE